MDYLSSKAVAELGSETVARLCLSNIFKQLHEALDRARRAAIIADSVNRSALGDLQLNRRNAQGDGDL